MSKAKGKVVSIATKRSEQGAEEAFLDLLHADISEIPERIQPIPAPLLERMARLRAKAEANRSRTSLLEG